ncbi:MAG TPA: hypothetical protein DCE42_00885 [Myxococcales bacterium]|nr:hypothetical protein [Deltaproteobacteria bacterium]HAA53275.1 hypothetical protein [Myxococcales bacterium]|tara:strand:- start:1263 stop:2114 length:852 start_codon:yes stop_codon:yes gene_type:complete
MIKVAVLADIHANIPALEAVIEDIEAQRPDEVLVGGDLVGRGPRGTAVVDRIAQLGWKSARGNHEDYMINFRKRRVPEEWHTSKEWAAARWMANELTLDALDYIDQLPFSVTSTLAPHLRVFHASPSANDDGIGTWTPPEKRREHFDNIDESILVCSHTHRPLLERYDDGLIVNIGSVGLPFNNDPRAQYVLFHIEDDDVEVEFRQVAYDRQETVTDYERTGFLEEAGITAQLLCLELEHASPFLVPYIRWAHQNELPPEDDHMQQFLEYFEAYKQNRQQQTS